MNITYFVSGVRQTGGAEIATQRLAEQVSKRGHLVTLVSAEAITEGRQNPAIIDYTQNYRLIYLPVWQRSYKTFAYMLVAHALWMFPVLLRSTDILHIRGITPYSFTLARMARSLGIKTLCVPMASGRYGDVARLDSRKQVPNFKVFDRLSALTKPLRDELIAAGVPPQQISVIPNGVDLSIFRQAEYLPTSPCAIFVGQFRAEKRVDLLLKAWVLVQEKYPQAQLTLLGGGQNLTEYRQLAECLGVQAIFVPNTNTAGVLAHLQKNSIFVQPGISEGMSNALLEAMAVGLAPIVSNTPANCAVIQTGINGLCYSPESAEDLALKIEQLLSDDSLRLKLGEAARQTIEANFSLDHVTAQYLALYRKMLGESL